MKGWALVLETNLWNGKHQNYFLSSFLIVLNFKQLIGEIIEWKVSMLFEQWRNVEFRCRSPSLYVSHIGEMLQLQYLSQCYYYAEIIINKFNHELKFHESSNINYWKNHAPKGSLSQQGYPFSLICISRQSLEKKLSKELSMSEREHTPLSVQDFGFQIFP